MYSRELRKACITHYMEIIARRNRHDYELGFLTFKDVMKAAIRAQRKVEVQS